MPKYATYVYNDLARDYLYNTRPVTARYVDTTKQAVQREKKHRCHSFTWEQLTAKQRQKMSTLPTFLLTCSLSISTVFCSCMSASLLVESTWSILATWAPKSLLFWTSLSYLVRRELSSWKKKTKKEDEKNVVTTKLRNHYISFTLMICVVYS